MVTLKNCEINKKIYLYQLLNILQLSLSCELNKQLIYFPFSHTGAQMHFLSLFFSTLVRRASVENAFSSWEESRPIFHRGKWPYLKKREKIPILENLMQSDLFFFLFSLLCLSLNRWNCSTCVLTFIPNFHIFLAWYFKPKRLVWSQWSMPQYAVQTQNRRQLAPEL